MANFLKDSIWGIITLGAFGSILGYLLIVVYAWLQKKLINEFSKYRKRGFEKFKSNYVSEFIETQIMYEGKEGKSLVFTKLLIDFIFYNGLLIICWVTFMQILIFAVGTNNSYLKYIAFLLGFISSFPSYQLGYLRGGLKAIYKQFIIKKANEIGVDILDEIAKEKYNSKR